MKNKNTEKKLLLAGQHIPLGLPDPAHTFHLAVQLGPNPNGGHPKYPWPYKQVVVAFLHRIAQIDWSHEHSTLTPTGQ